MLRLSLWSVSFIFIFVSIFECSTSFVPIYFILTLCFYQHEIVSMNLDNSDFKQLLDEVFVISGIIKVEVSVISRTLTLTETLIIPDITKT